MLALRASMLLAVLGLLATNQDASALKAPQKVPQNPQQTQRQKEHTFHGHITHVHHTKDGKHHGRITVKHHHKGRNVSETFHISAGTNIHTGGASKSGSTILHKGLRVAVRHHGHHADDILIHHHKKQQ